MTGCAGSDLASGIVGAPEVHHDRQGNGLCANRRLSE